MAGDGHGNSLLLAFLAALHTAHLGWWVSVGGTSPAPGPAAPAHELAVEEPVAGDAGAGPSVLKTHPRWLPRPGSGSRRRQSVVPQEEEDESPDKGPVCLPCPPAPECRPLPAEPCPGVAWVLSVAVLVSTSAGVGLGCCLTVRFRAAVVRAPRRRLLARPAENHGSPSGASGSESVARLRPATVDPRSL